MAAAFRAEGLGLLLDIVPNHMGIGGDANGFWLDVLAWGRDSRFAPLVRHRLGRAGRGGQGGAAGARRGLSARRWPAARWRCGARRTAASRSGRTRPTRCRSARATTPTCCARPDARRWPGRPTRWRARVRTIRAGARSGRRSRRRESGSTRGLRPFAARPGDAASSGARSRPSSRGSTGGRRSSPSSATASTTGASSRSAISRACGSRTRRSSRPPMACALGLVAEGVADGLRVDHIDGLRDPAAYGRRLRARAGGAWLLVEKILAPDEALPDDWGVDGTTGYEVANLLVGLLVDPAGEAALDAAYRAFTGRTEPPRAIVRGAKREVLERMLNSEVAALVRRLRRLADASPRFADLGTGAIRAALVETVAAMDVYRTYADAERHRRGGPRTRGATRWRAGRRRRAGSSRTPSRFVAAVLTLDARRLAGGRRRRRRDRVPGPAADRAGDGEGARGHGALPLRAADRAERGRVASRAASRRRSTPSTAPTPSACGAFRGRCSPPRPTTPSAARMPARASRRSPIMPRPGPPPWRTGTRSCTTRRRRSTPTMRGSSTSSSSAPGRRSGGRRWSRSRSAFAAFVERVQAAMLKSVREASENTRWVFGDDGLRGSARGLRRAGADPGRGVPRRLPRASRRGSRTRGRRSDWCRRR